MSTKINVRSPYYIKVTGASTTLSLNLKVWKGSIGSPPGSATYSLSKASTEISAGSYYATFEISELIRDYIEITFNGDYESTAVYVNDGTNTYIAFDGYGYFEEGVNPELSRTKLISNTVIWRPRNENINVPFLADETYEVVMASNGSPVRTENIIGTTSSSNLVRYVSPAGDDTIFNFRQRVLDDGGIYEYNYVLDRLDCRVDANAVDEVRVYQVDGNDMTDAPYESIKIRTMHSDRFPDRKITFVNKFGVLQDVYFFAKEIEGITTTTQKYKRNSFNDNALTYSGHQYQNYDTQGREILILNTGFVSEDYNEVLKQLLMSEQVWVTKTTDKENNVFPVNPVTNSLSYQTSLNDKLVSYTIEFEYAFDKIQNIR